MSHEVEKMAYVGETPWHGLGSLLSKGATIDDWTVEAGMDWFIKEASVNFDAVNSEFETVSVPFDKQKVLYRSDTLAPLSVVSDRYNVVQPIEIMEFYRDLTLNSDFELESAGVLKEGKKLWALAKTGQSMTLKGDDRTESYILLATACDGTMATTAQFTSIRVVCANTLSWAINAKKKDDHGVIKVPHSTVFNAEVVKEALGIRTKAWDDYAYAMKKLTERRVKDSEVERFITHLYKDIDARLPMRISKKTGQATVPNARAKKRIAELYNGHGHGANLESAKGTAYGLLNAVTEFIDHERGTHSNDNRQDSAWFGTGLEIKERALLTAYDLIA